ncbi:endonuclease/exonuclease/phosphatase family protein [Paenibacillus sp. GCM10023248]|uniref:endonuclease/exonuclease/phosphatase family protein n=1 Tax=unclassified Paenibacillus TaxID=185978 RepID=UPI002379A712|nr:endonuclease/exonuclease/phosphatase family protein [Paenibacillus sp. MAHUQ-63]MDD9269077.1 endonuclease/exonuclease/phosphatase family protein [Paenibacillus sp. MAHUQ-63]
MELTVMTFNLRVHVEQDGENAWPHRIEAAAEAVRASRAAIICTQEGKHAMLRDLQERLPEYAWLGEGRSGGEDGEYCAVFYLREDFELMESGTFGLSERPEELGFMSWQTACPRICTWAQLRHKDGRSWLVFNTHLDHISEEARREGAKLIVQRMEDIVSDGSAELPAVLCGDFNCGPGSEAVRILHQAGMRSVYAVMDEPPGLTFHNFRGGEAGEPIDYIFISAQAGIVSAHVDRSLYGGGRYPSDHYPVCARVEL